MVDITESLDAWFEHTKEDELTPLFVKLCKVKGLPAPVAEHRFHPTRKWRFDFAWPDAMIALEVEGGIWTQGRHTRGSGFVKDISKYNAAAVMGWRVLRTTPTDLESQQTFDMVREAMKARAA